MPAKAYKIAYPGTPRTETMMMFTGRDQQTMESDLKRLYDENLIAGYIIQCPAEGTETKKGKI